jgi:hypothetical protein
MNAHTTFTLPGDSARPTADQPGFGPASTGAMSLRWAALHDAARVVTLLAGLAPEEASPEVSDFPEAMRAAGGWRCEQAERGIEDLTAIMEPALAALLGVSATGANPAVPALALWQEFQAARTALLALASPARGTAADGFR